MSAKLESNGIKIGVNENDHAPAHVHAVKGTKMIRIDLTTLRSMDRVTEFSRAEVKFIIEVVTNHLEELLEDWNAKHPKRK